MSAETRAEKRARIDAEMKAWKESGIPGSNMVEVGTLTRGVRGHHAFRFDAESRDWFYRDVEDEEPSYFRLFALIPPSEESP